jgi:Tol biopolymer transport system component
MSRMSPRFVVLTVVTFCGAAALVLPAAGPRPVVASGPLFTTFPCPSNPASECVMKGLDNPRGLVFFPSDDDPENDDRDDWDLEKHGSGGGWDHADGRHHDDNGSASEAILYVAEAGRGGLDNLATAPSFPGQAGGTRYYGPTGAISRLWNGVQTRVVSGLPSHANVQGRQAIGPHDIAFLARRRDDHRSQAMAGSPDCDPACAYVAIGLFQPPRFREDYPFLKDFAKLARVAAKYVFSRPSVTAKWDYIADLGKYEADNDPDQDLYPPDKRKLDTNPYSLLAKPGSRAFVVIDASGNSMLRVGANSRISTLAAFAPHPEDPVDSVPTSVAVGPDGTYYVGELTGFPFPPAAANIYRVGRPGEPPEVCLTRFTTIIDIAFDKRGSLYVLEYSGTLIRVVPDRSVARDRDDNGDMCAQYHAGERTPVLSGLTNPTSVAVGPDEALYISNRGIFPGTGEVIRFVPEPPVGQCSKQRDCDDGNVCTQDKCDKHTGTCEFKPIHRRRACDDGNACTSVDVCDRGVCQGSNLPNGTVCSDGNACTQSDTCQSGACTGADPVICSASDQCHVAGTCDTATGSCSDPAAPDGTACDDTETCSGQDACQAGACTVPGALVQRIAFATNRDNPSTPPDVNSAEVYLMDPDGANLLRLTTNTVSDQFPALSPDGKGRIVFDSNRNNVLGDPVNLVDLWLMRSDGSNPQYLVRGASASWSPDSQSITFQRSRTGTGLPINGTPGAPAPDSDIFVAGVCDLRAGLPATNITNSPLKIDVDPDWRGDGQKIVFTNFDVGDSPTIPTSAEIWTINPDGSGLAQLTFNAVEERAPAWSPDGTRITYMCKQGPTVPNGLDNEICVMNADGSDQRQLTFNTVNDASPQFSPDGRKIVFHRGGGGGGNTQIFVITLNPDASTSEEPPLTSPPGISLFPNWGFVRRRP